MPFDPTRPVEDSPLDAEEMRNQLNALKELLDAQAQQIAELQLALAGKATAVAQVQNLSFPPDVQPQDPITGDLILKVNELLDGLKG